jgi:integrase/recombinase XerC
VALVAVNPAQGLRAPKSPRRLPRALDVDQVTRVLEQDTDGVLALRDQAMWETLYSCGLRVSELVGLNLADLDLRNREARVLGKGRKQRVVPVGRHARERSRPGSRLARHCCAATSRRCSSTTAASA